jgi:transcriptional regulator GlxA family with amidase domain
MRKVALVIFPGVQSLDVSGPLDVFAEANGFLPPAAHYRLEVIGSERGQIRCSNGLRILADRHIDEVNEPFDLLLVAGGPVLAHEAPAPALLQWLRGASVRARRFGAICNGALVLGHAGLLAGRTVTTHWSDAAALAALCPTAKVEADRIFVQDGALYTSAGVTAGIDLSLYLVGQDHGAELALKVAKRLVVFTQRAGGQSQFSPFLTPYAEAASPVALVREHVQGHLGDDLSVAVLADVATMSRRNFSRVFARDAGMTPAEFVERARVDAARVLLEGSAAPLKSIAYDCGLRDAHQLRAAFKRRLGVTPQQYRLHFGAAGE